MHIPGIGSVDEVLVMPNCPSVLSLGKLCLDKGYSFEWKAGEAPTLTNQAGRTITLKIDRYVPVLPAGGAIEPTNSQESTPAATNRFTPFINDEQVLQLFRD